MSDNAMDEPGNSSEEARIKEHLGKLFVDALLSSESEDARSQLAQGLAKDIERHLAVFLQTQESALIEQRKAEFDVLEEARAKLLSEVKKVNVASADTGVVRESLETDAQNESRVETPSSDQSKFDETLEKTRASANGRSRTWDTNPNILWGMIAALAIATSGLGVGLYLISGSGGDTANDIELAAVCEELRPVAEGSSDGEATADDVLNSALPDDEPAQTPDGAQARGDAESAAAIIDPMAAERDDLLARLEVLACPVEEEDPAEEGPTGAEDPAETPAANATATGTETES